MALPSRYKAVTCRYGPRDWPLVDLIDDWGNRVLKSEPHGLWDRIAAVVSAVPMRPIQVRLTGTAGIERIELP